MVVPRRIRLVHGPTPLVHHQRLAERFGVELWIKRDDATGGAEAGNKLRKLEFLLADAIERGADTLVTCGDVQSNHARATALIAASHGLRCALLLWSRDTVAAVPWTGNALLCRLAGAHVLLPGPVPASQRDRALQELCEDVARRGGVPYAIPEGGSNGLGALGYVEACREIRTQLDLGLGGAGGEPFDVIVHACGSGGTAAGLALGAAAYGVARRVLPMAVCLDATAFELAIGRIAAEARKLRPDLPAPVEVTVHEGGIGPGYGMMSPQQARFVAELARYGLVLDPVYTGKAMCGLADAVRTDASLLGKRVLFVHTGGLPGLLARGDAFEDA